MAGAAAAAARRRCCCGPQQGSPGCVEYPTFCFREYPFGLPACRGRTLWWHGIQSSSASISATVTITVVTTSGGVDTTRTATIDAALPFAGGRPDQSPIDGTPWPSWTSPPFLPTPLDETGGSLDDWWTYCHRYNIPLFKDGAESICYPLALDLSGNPFVCCGGNTCLQQYAGLQWTSESVTGLLPMTLSAIDGSSPGASGGSFFLSIAGATATVLVNARELAWEISGGGVISEPEDACPSQIPGEGAKFLRWRPGGDGLSFHREGSVEDANGSHFVSVDVAISASDWWIPAGDCGCAKSWPEFSADTISLECSVSTAPPGDPCPSAWPVYSSSALLSPGVCCEECPEEGTRFRGYDRLEAPVETLLPIPSSIYIWGPGENPSAPQCEGCKPSAPIPGVPNGEFIVVQLSDAALMPCEFVPESEGGCAWNLPWLPNGYVRMSVNGAWKFADPTCLGESFFTGSIRGYFRVPPEQREPFGSYEVFDTCGRPVGVVVLS